MEGITQRLAPDAEREGWVGITNGRKYHYVIDNDTLCGVVVWGGEVELGNDDSPDNCSACKKRLSKKRAKLQVTP